MAARGDCMETAGRLIMDFGFLAERPGAKLIHAIVEGQGPLAGRRFVHAWVEAGGMAIDRSGGRDIELPALLYRLIGNVEQVHEYTPEQAREMMVETGTFGPWAPELDKPEYFFLK